MSRHKEDQHESTIRPCKYDPGRRPAALMERRPGQATAAILGGNVEIGLLGGVGVVNAFVSCASDLVFIGSFKNIMTQSILAKPEVSKLQDLRGKKIGVTRIGSNTHYFSVQALRRAGMSPEKDITFIQPVEIWKRWGRFLVAPSMRLRFCRPPTAEPSRADFATWSMGRIYLFLMRQQLSPHAVPSLPSAVR